MPFTDTTQKCQHCRHFPFEMLKERHGAPIATKLPDGTVVLAHAGPQVARRPQGFYFSVTR
jgi:hypothetical protein